MKGLLANLDRRWGATCVAFHRARAKLREARDYRSGPWEDLRRGFYRELWQATADRVGASLEDLGEGFLRIRRGRASTIVNRFEVMLDSRLALKVAGDKPLCYRLFAELGAPVIPHFVADLARLSEAWSWARARSRPVVVKPARDGSVGRGVTTGVRSEGELRKAARRAAAGGRRILIEEMHGGASFRLLYLEGELIDAVRRGPPTVVGDGSRTIRALVAAENARRLASRQEALHPLVVDLELEQHLRDTGRSLRDVPPSGATVALKRVVNENARRDNESVTSSVHPSTVALGRRIVAGFGLALAGVDLLTEDVSRPLAETGGVVNEVNTTPGLHHHVLVSNPDASRDAPRAVLEHLLARGTPAANGRPAEDA